MAVVIRLKRAGKKNSPYYRLVVANKIKPRDGKFIEILGSYDPKKVEKKAMINKERLDHWVKNGAVMSPTVSKLVAQS